MLGKNDLHRVIGEQIKVKRLANSLKQENLACKVGLTRSSIAQIEAGKQAPSIFLLYQLCDALKINIFDVLPREEFDPLSADRFTGKRHVRDILEQVKMNGGKYATAEYSNSGK
jgi:transcriptional regulator with XRE-family HTH domain